MSDEDDDVIFGPPAPVSPDDFWDPAPKDSKGNQLAFGQGPLYAGGWDTVVLAGQKLPGKCDVRGEESLQVDQQKGPKHDGAILILHGILPCPIDIVVKLWTKAQWDRFCELVPLFWRKPTKDSPDVKALAKAQKVSVAEAQKMVAAVPIYWPGLRYSSVVQVIVKGVGLPEDGPEPQSKIIRIKCVQYVPPTRKTSASKVEDAPIPVDAEVVTPPKPSEEGGGPEHE